MATTKNVFTKLNKKEILKVVDSILTYRGEMLLWSKGDEQKEKFRAEDFDEETMSLYLSPILINTSLCDKSILLSFENKNLQYFTTGKLSYDNDQKLYKIELTKDFFKCDKRKHFRLEKSELDHLSVVIENTTYPCFDISTGGISLLLNEETNFPFKKGEIIKAINIKLNKLDITIQESEIRYIMELTDHLTNRRQRKVGIMFLKMDSNSEATIFREINNAIYKKLNPLGV